jgi:competence protein ComGC
MKFPPMRSLRRTSVSGLTLVELLVVIVVLAVLGLLLLPSLIPPKTRATRVQCSYQLRQVGLAFRIWGGDHQGRSPMQVSITNGGAMEPAAAGDPVPVFQVMSNELSTPKFLICPADPHRFSATNFTEGFRRANIGYFVNLDAADANPQTILCGDRNITNNRPVRSGILELTTNQVVGWYQEPDTFWRRLIRGRKISGHGGIGNLALSDGSVSSFNNLLLNQALVDSGVATNRLILP